MALRVELRWLARRKALERFEVDAHRAGRCRDLRAARAHDVAERHRASVGDGVRKPKSRTAVAPGVGDPSVRPGAMPMPTSRKRRSSRIARCGGLASHAPTRLVAV